MENEKLKNLRLEIEKLVDLYAKEKYKPISFVPGKTIIPPSGKLIGEKELQNMVSASLPLPLFMKYCISSPLGSFVVILDAVAEESPPPPPPVATTWNGATCRPPACATGVPPWRRRQISSSH